jgi:hypothetical protein
LGCFTDNSSYSSAGWKWRVEDPFDPLDNVARSLDPANIPRVFDELARAREMLKQGRSFVNEVCEPVVTPVEEPETKHAKSGLSAPSHADGAGSAVTDSKTSNEKTVTFSINLPQKRCVEIIIGQGGKTVKALQKRTRTKIHLSNGIVTIRGSSQAIAAAEKKIQALIATEKKTSNARMSEPKSAKKERSSKKEATKSNEKKKNATKKRTQ